MTRCSALRTCTTFVRPPNFSSQSLETHWNRVSHESPVHSVFPLVENESAVNVILRVFAHVYSYVCIYIYIYTYTKYGRRWPRLNPFTTGLFVCSRATNGPFPLSARDRRSTSTVTEGKEHLTSNRFEFLSLSLFFSSGKRRSSLGNSIEVEGDAHENRERKIKARFGGRMAR